MIKVKFEKKNSMSRKRFGQGDEGQVAGQTPDKFLRDIPRAGQRGTSPSTHQKTMLFAIQTCRG